MLEKPDHLGPPYAAQFCDPSVAAAYRFRPPYSYEVFATLERLIGDSKLPILDIGAGTGEIARPLADRGYGVDAVDPSPEIIGRGKSLTGGNSELLTWIHGSAETAPLCPRYALITAAASLHWTDWGITLPRLRHVLMPGAVLALIDNRCLPTPWDRDLSPAIARYSTNRAYRAYNLVDELTTRQLFRAQGRHEAAVFTFAQPLGDYIESFHARNGFLRDRMTCDETSGFDSEVRAMVAPYAPDGIVRLQIISELIWGLPAPQAPLPTAPSGTGNNDPESSI